MNTIDYIYRFDPQNPIAKPTPLDAQSARKMLEDGNRMFSRWMESCRNNSLDAGVGANSFVSPWNGLQLGLGGPSGQFPKQAPFAVVVGCSDARVPIEMIFGQGFNDLFVIRVAGNVLGDECLGSVDFALTALSESVKVVVMLGHSGCGAVKGAVDAYLNPSSYWAKSTSHHLRTILRRIFISVREGAGALREVWGADSRQMPAYRDALIEIAVALNSAQSAYDLRLEVERAGKSHVDVLYSVYDIRTHRVNLALDPPTAGSPTNAIRLIHAPRNPTDFTAMALQIARRLEPHG